MYTKQILLITILALLMGSCREDASLSSGSLAGQIEGTVSALDTATAMAEEVIATYSAELTQTAQTEKSTAKVLTASAIPIGTPSLTATRSPAYTSTPTPSLTPYRSPTPTLTSTMKPSPTLCFVVSNNWCIEHEGCQIMEISNKTDSAVTIRIWNTYDTDIRFTVPPGQCKFMVRPGMYFYEFTYCGKTHKDRHAFNGNWNIKFECK